MRTMRSNVCVFGFISLAIIGCKKLDKHSAVVDAGAETAATVQKAPESLAPDPIDVLGGITNFNKAVEYVKPYMTDTQNDISSGAILLSVWGAKNMKLSDVVVSKNETSFALVKKDSDETRGKKMCVRGSLIEIHVENTKVGKIAEGLLMDNSMDLVKFIATHSTGELVESSPARFCGVVIGRYDYQNSAGGTGHAVQMVGIFDLPENK